MGKGAREPSAVAPAGIVAREPSAVVPAGIVAREPAPIAKALLNDAPLQKSLYLSAYRTAAGNLHEAEDLYQQTIVRALERTDPPPTGDLPAVHKFYHNILKGLAANRRRAMRGRKSDAYDDESLPPSSRRGMPHPERALLERHDAEERQRQKDEVRAELEGEHIPLAVWDLAERGVHSTPEIERTLGCTTEQVYLARRRIADAARRVKARARAREAVPV